jgi:DNA-directed RNA polymerase specialized sigma24 family protein
MDGHHVASGPEAAIDWVAARQFLSRALAKNLRRASPADIQDLTQEACINLLRTVRREPVRNLNALMNDIARKTAIGHARRSVRWHSLLHRAAVEQASTPGSTVEVGDPIERFRFVVLEFFRRNSPNCHDLAIRYLQEGNWAEVAAHLGRNPAAIRQQWSRCVGVLRERTRRSAGILWEWTRESQGESDEHA